MIAAALLGEDERVELIEGEVLLNMPVGDRHSNCVDLLNFTLNRLAAGRHVIRIQNPVVCATSEPQPDVSVVPFRPGLFGGHKPSAADVTWIIEVADRSLDDDLGRKATLYAENGIPEYWVIDLTTDTVHVHRGPRPDGTWAAVTAYARGDTLAVAALPSMTVAVADLLS
jgi:Uma2 family endonuclease